MWSSLNRWPSCWGNRLEDGISRHDFKMDNPYEPDSDNGKAWLKGYGEGQELPQKVIPKPRGL